MDLGQPHLHSRFGRIASNLGGRGVVILPLFSSVSVCQGLLASEHSNRAARDCLYGIVVACVKVATSHCPGHTTLSCQGVSANGLLGVALRPLPLSRCHLSMLYIHRAHQRMWTHRGCAAQRLLRSGGTIGGPCQCLQLV